MGFSTRDMSFSTRADLVCHLSDQAQPVHFLSRNYGSLKVNCVMCRSQKYWMSRYYLHCDTCNLDVHKHCYLASRCRMSTDLTKPHTLEKVYSTDDNFSCSACQRSLPYRSTCYYHCATCNVDFHKRCILYLPKITHPFHPHHPLKFTFSSSFNYSYSDLNDSIELPYSWLGEKTDPEATTHGSEVASLSEAKCKCCQNQLKDAYYHCSMCNFSMNLTCTKYPPPLTLLNLKSHEHPLNLFPRRINLPCDACGLSLNNTQDHVYSCHLCSYMVHRTCIYLPRVIKITRHGHRLSLSSSLPSKLFPCGVCRHPIDISCGQFSCQNGCDYAIHSKCAVNGNVWDGVDLDGVPEEPDEDIKPFVRIDADTILHFTHEHHLKLQTNNNDNFDGFCQACALQVLIYESFYCCKECGFLLHEECASLPRKKDHPLHKHPLILHRILPEPVLDLWEGWRDTISLYIEGIFKCNGCDQRGYGFVYKCSQKDCKFLLDTRCASLPDPVIHGSHPHDLFFNFTQGECMGCKSSKCSPFSLECMQCKSFLGLKCASLPNLIRYKHDKHPLTLCYGEEDTPSGQYWCEICEGKLDAKEWFYKCDDYCGVTVHISCLLGTERLIKPMSIKMNIGRTSVIPNSSNTRAICRNCKHRSTEPFLFKQEYHGLGGFKLICSLRCLFE